MKQADKEAAAMPLTTFPHVQQSPAFLLHEFFCQSLQLKSCGIKSAIVSESSWEQNCEDMGVQCR